MWGWSFYFFLMVFNFLIIIGVIKNIISNIFLINLDDHLNFNEIFEINFNFRRMIQVIHATLMF